MKTKLFFMLFSFAIAFTLFAQEEGKSSDETKTFEVITKDVTGFHMMYYEFKGPYEESFNDYMGLIEYMANNNIEMGPHAVGLYYDNPEEVAPEELRSEVGFMAAGEAESGEKYKYKKIDDFKAVAVKYYSMDDIQSAYNALGKYIEENGLIPIGFAIEVYYSDDPAKVDAEILMPIKE